MRNFFEKIKKIDTKVLIGLGVGIATVVLLVLFLFIGGKTVVDSDKGESDSQVSSETEAIGEGYQTEGEELVVNTQETESQNQNSQEIESQETEKQESTGNISESQAEEDKTTTNNTKPSVPSAPSQPEQVPPSSDNANKEEVQTPPSAEEIPITIPYTVKIASVGGHNLYNVKVHAYTDKEMTNLFVTAATNSKGLATLQLEQGKEYVISLSNVPEGYKVDLSYAIVGETTSIVLESSVVTGEEFPSKKLKVGNVMYDFTVPSADGSELKFSDVIKTKELVVLNFWYVNCQFCVMEFPYMSNVYNIYKDKVEIMALNPFDDMEVVKTFLAENPLPFKVATCDASIPNLFGVDAYPVSVIIDKYGVIREIEKGAILQESKFISLFEKYI